MFHIEPLSQKRPVESLQRHTMGRNVTTGETTSRLTEQKNKKSVWPHSGSEVRGKKTFQTHPPKQGCGRDWSA